MHAYIILCTCTHTYTCINEGNNCLNVATAIAIATSDEVLTAHNSLKFVCNF